jgi:O-succinylbenzoic acid--CoA ligase
MMSMSSPANQLYLNPRMPPEERTYFTSAWRELIGSRFKDRVGIATSGSSGDSVGRLIVLSREALDCSAYAVNQRLGSGPHDVWFKVLPDFHVGGLGIKVRAALSGAKVIESPALISGQIPNWNVHEFVRELQQSAATLVSLVPTQVFDLVRHQLLAPESVRAVVVGGGRLESVLLAEAVALGWPLLVSYGLTECSSQVATAIRAGDQGMRPLSHVRLRIGEGERIEIASDALLSGQIQFCTMTKRARFEEFPPGTWFRTEDCGHFDGDVGLSVLGRVGDFVKIGGEGVVISRLEDVLLRLCADARFAGDAAVLAAVDDRLGAIVVMLATGDKLAAADLRDRFNQVVMPFERIREFHHLLHLENLPRSPLGKLLRQETLTLIERPIMPKL